MSRLIWLLSGSLVFLPVPDPRRAGNGRQEQMSYATTKFLRMHVLHGCILN